MLGNELSLAKGIVSIFYLDTDSSCVPVKFISLLDADELNVYYGYKVVFKKTEFLAGRVLAKLVLANYCKTRPDNVQFIKNNYGKLYLNQPLIPKNDHYPQFNISHSHGMVVCAVTLGNEIGVDVEKINEPILDIVDRFFAVGEREYIAQFAIGERHRIAYQIWTMKEALVKAQGTGLSMALDGYDVTLLDKEVFLKCIELKPDYLVSVAVSNPPVVPFQTRLIEITDLNRLIIS